MSKIKLVSSDLNGTLVHQHTMSDMIRLYIGEEQFRKADAVFKRQTSGTASMEEAFGTAGPLTKGLTLRQAIDYAQKEMRYLTGFEEFLNSLYERGIPFVINSTGYSVTIHAIRARWGAERIHGSIGNTLEFGQDGDPAATLREDELEKHVRQYVLNSDSSNAEYDAIQATGRIHLGITDEAAKATLLFEYARRYFPELQPTEMLHMGDTIGDSGGIYGVANAGGTGVAFNYNEPLERFLKEKIEENPVLAERIYFVDQKGPHSDLKKVAEIVFSV